jgi:hypothetical protein
VTLAGDALSPKGAASHAKRAKRANAGDNAKRATMAAMGTAGATLSETQADRAALNLLGFDLHMATERDDIPAMRRVIEDGDWNAFATKEEFVNWVNPSSVDAMSGHSALHVAAQLNNLEAAKYLISEGAHLNLQSTEGLTALMRACDAGMPEMCELLLESGANPDLDSKTGNTALVISMQFDTMLLELRSDDRKKAKSEAAQQLRWEAEAEEEAAEHRRKVDKMLRDQEEAAEVVTVRKAKKDADDNAVDAQKQVKEQAKSDLAKARSDQEAVKAKCLSATGVLWVEVVQARGLHAHDKGGTSDPFVVLSTGNQRSQTEVIKKTLTPGWAEQFTFEAIALSETLSVTVKDKDMMSSEVMGTVNVALASLSGSVGGSVQHWYPLSKNAKKKKKSSLSHGTTLVVEVVQARGLHAHDKGGASDPFVVLNLGKQKKNQKQTKVIKKTLSPSWTEEFSFAAVDVSEKLSVTVKDKDMMSSEVMGTVDVDLSEVAKVEGGGKCANGIR